MQNALVIGPNPISPAQPGFAPVPHDCADFADSFIEEAAGPGRYGTMPEGPAGSCSGASSWIGHKLAVAPSDPQSADAEGLPCRKGPEAEVIAAEGWGGLWPVVQLPASLGTGQDLPPQSAGRTDEIATDLDEDNTIDSVDHDRALPHPRSEPARSAKAVELPLPSSSRDDSSILETDPGSRQARGTGACDDPDVIITYGAIMASGVRRDFLDGKADGRAPHPHPVALDSSMPLASAPIGHDLLTNDPSETRTEMQSLLRPGPEDAAPTGSGHEVWESFPLCSKARAGQWQVEHDSLNATDEGTPASPSGPEVKLSISSPSAGQLAPPDLTSSVNFRASFWEQAFAAATGPDRENPSQQAQTGGAIPRIDPAVPVIRGLSGSMIGSSAILDGLDAGEETISSAQVKANAIRPQGTGAFSLTAMAAASPSKILSLVLAKGWSESTLDAEGGGDTLTILSPLPATPGSASNGMAAPSSASPPVPQISAQLSAALQQFSGGVGEITLAPAELGRIRLRMEPDARDPDRLVIMISFERPETLELFRRHAGDLADAIRTAGYSRSIIDFGQDGEGRHPEGGRDHRDRLAVLTPDDADTGQVPVHHVIGETLDIRL